MGKIFIYKYNLLKLILEIKMNTLLTKIAVIVLLMGEESSAITLRSILN